jgi:hypothetical protein
METIKLKARVDADGILTIELPKSLANKDTEFVLIYQVDEPPQEVWTAFVERMYGTLADDPLERPAQLALETRDEIE